MQIKNSTIIVTALIACAFAVCAAVAPSKDADCDSNAKTRRTWLTTKSDGRSPLGGGYRITGECDTKLLHREFSCEESSVRRINADNPYLKEALALGFTIYVCETLNGSRTEYPVQHIVAP